MQLNIMVSLEAFSNIRPWVESVQRKGSLRQWNDPGLCEVRLASLRDDLHPGTRPCPRGHCEPLPNVSAHCQHRDSPSSSTSPLSSASGPPWPAVGSHIECPCFCTWRPICQGPGRKHPRRSFRSECGLGYFTVERLNRNQGSVGSQVRRQLIVFGKRVCYFWFLRGMGGHTLGAHTLGALQGSARVRRQREKG